MRHFDLTPLYRSTVGFDRLATMLDKVAAHTATLPDYPPYNIEKTSDDGWRISLAVAGFSRDDIAIESHEDNLVITGANKEASGADRSFLHKGIAERAFERRFQLAEHVRVAGASMADGLLHIDLMRIVPEALKPRRIAITTGEPSRDSVTGADSNTPTIDAIAAE